MKSQKGLRLGDGRHRACTDVGCERGAAPIKIGMSMAQTGGLAAGGKASLLGIEIWRDDINARAACSAARSSWWSMMTSRAPAETPAIYAKLLDVDKVDLLFAPYATGPDRADHAAGQAARHAADGNFSFQVNSKVGHDMWFNNAPWGPPTVGPCSNSSGLGQKAGQARRRSCLPQIPGICPESREDGTRGRHEA